MTIKDMFLGGGGILIVILSLFQVSKIQINPWTTIFNWIGKQLNHDLTGKVDGINKDIKSMQKDIDKLKEADDMTAALNSRYRIIRFADEIYHGQLHSHEHYKQILYDITTYESYCDSHPEFPNQIAVAAIKQIKQMYDKHLANHDFLQ